MGRRRSSRDKYRAKEKQLRKLRRTYSLKPPYPCPMCGQPTLTGEKVDDTNYRFKCTSCGFEREVAVEHPRLEMIDAYTKLVDEYYAAIEESGTSAD